MKIRVGEQLLKIGETDKMRGTNPRPIGEGVVEGGERWTEYNREVDDEERQDEEPCQPFTPPDGGGPSDTELSGALWGERTRNSSIYKVSNVLDGH